MNLESKVALIVGGTGSIGRATAIAFANAGANVVIAGRNQEAGEEGIRLVQETGADGIFIHADVTDTQSIEKLVENTIKKFNRIDCAFNNAGWEGVAAKTADINESDWQKMLDIKLTGVWRCMKSELNQMMKQGNGTIVNTAGNWGLIGFPEFASYCAAAHGIMGLTKAASLEYASESIRINAVCPGAVDTPLLDRLVGGDADIKQAMGEQLAMGRIAKPEEIAHAVIWLCSDNASYITGQGLVLNGGG